MDVETTVSTLMTDRFNGTRPIPETLEGFRETGTMIGAHRVHCFSSPETPRSPQARTPRPRSFRFSNWFAVPAIRSAVGAPGRQQQTEIRTIGGAISVEVTAIGSPCRQKQAEIRAVDGAVVVHVLGTATR
jgi:hypothetical protein